MLHSVECIVVYEMKRITESVYRVFLRIRCRSTQYNSNIKTEWSFTPYVFAAYMLGLNGSSPKPAALNLEAYLRETRARSTCIPEPMCSNLGLESIYVF